MNAKDINISQILPRLRREKGLTQDELAGYLGVTKAAVSKWETGQSYPDITLLPVIASYFSVSIDDLIGYEPQMTKGDIRKLYLRLCSDFVSKNFDDVIAECRSIIKKYNSCYSLLNQMALLYLNHFMLASSQEKSAEIISEAKNLFEKIETECGDAALSSSSKQGASYCSIILGDPKSVLLSYEDTSLLHVNPEQIVAIAHRMTGDISKARNTVRFGLFQDMTNTVGLFTLLLELCETEEKLNQAYHIACGIGELYEVEKFNPSILLNLKLSAAKAYIMLGNTEKSLDILTEYADLCTGMNFNELIGKSDFFDTIGEWYEEFGLGLSPPRDEKIIRQSMLSGVRDDPVYLPVSEHPKYKAVVEKLKGDFIHGTAY